MDYVPGVTLAQLLAKGGPITEAQAFELFAPLAEALDYAHSQGVIHRDIKPSNILISETGIPFLADFGIASELRDAIKDQVSIAGTLPYMSPEQLLGNAPSESQDIYSLGVTIYQCLVGHPPFYQGDITYQILHRDPAPLSCNCCFCTRTMFALAKVGSKRPAKARQIADTAKRLHSFTRWVVTQAEEVCNAHIANDRMAVLRLESAAAQCLKDLMTRGSVQINLPFLWGPDVHFVLIVSWDDVRRLFW
jgi:serine/threonine protein kinase